MPIDVVWRSFKDEAKKKGENHCFFSNMMDSVAKFGPCAFFLLVWAFRTFARKNTACSAERKKKDLGR